ncbi:MAG: hypothetical protein ACR2M6_02515 [Vampirovibrionia bacterium]
MKNQGSYLTTRGKQVVWICSNHIPQIVYAINVESCSMISCKNKRPSISRIPTKEENLSLRDLSSICMNIPCGNMRLPNRKYCSDKCRKDRARKKYRQKKRAEKSARK